MEVTILILTIIATSATVISTVIAVRAKNEARNTLNEIKAEKNRNLSNSGSVNVSNSGRNSGVISGINTGEVRGNVEHQ